MARRTLKLKGIDPLLVTGVGGEYLNLLKENFDVKITARGNKIILEGKDKEVSKVERLLSIFKDLAGRGRIIDTTTVMDEIEKIKGIREKEEGLIYTPRKVIKPKTDHQREYIKCIEKFDVVFAIGPAGTGKTYLAVAMAVQALENEEIDRIILTRPAVEAGESLGYLPGDFKEKVDPYLRPLYDALADMIPPERMRRLMDNQIIEVAPLAYMRGRTLSDAYIILDEAQNTTSSQMKMFLTRLGWNSKAIITGDITQVDIKFVKSGLVHAIEILKNVKGVKFVHFDKSDVVRPPLVSEIIKAYEEAENVENNR